MWVVVRSDYTHIDIIHLCYANYNVYMTSIHAYGGIKNDINVGKYSGFIEPLL